MTRQPLARLRGMSLAEIACRGRQETSKWIDRVASARPGTASGRLAGLGSTERFLDDKARRLIDPSAADTVHRRCPKACERTIAAARGICEGRFTLLGYDQLSFGSTVDWHLDPIRNRRAPDRHWTRIDPLNPRDVGDSKIIWELSRHQWLVTLGQAYAITRDERYSRRAAELLEQWLEANPPGWGINWTSSLELAMRVVAWCWALALLRDAPNATRPPFAMLGHHIAIHARQIARYLSYYFSPNTHLTGEALGLVYAGVLFDDLRDAERWRSLGREILIQESERQILDDGVYFEQATCYQRYTVDIYLHLLLLSERFGLEVPVGLVSRVETAVEALRDLTQPDGQLFPVGDGDAGSLLPLARRRPDDCRGTFATAAVVLRRPDVAWQESEDSPEVGWLFGERGLAQLDRRPTAAITHAVSRVLPDGGYVIMASPDRSRLLVFDVGPLGCSVSGAHGHADLLSIQCSAFGQPWIVDSGTGCYTADPAWRSYFRTSAAHSTVTVDEMSQAEPRGVFAWTTRPTARLRGWYVAATCECADGEHDAYGRLPDPVRHRRRVLFVQPAFWVVVDDLLGLAEHVIDVRFQVATEPVMSDGGAVRLTRGEQHFWLLPFSPAAVEATVEQAWRSDAYGCRSAGWAVRYRVQGPLPARVATVLWPAAGPIRRPRVAPSFSTPTGTIDSLLLPDRAQRIVIEADRLFLESIPCAAS